MTRARLTGRGRRAAGFTLVELMVSAAVCVIIMTVLATCFQTGIDTMRQMRSVAKLQDRLRTATEVIRRDLKADHFTVADPAGGTAKLSDLKQGAPGSATSPGSSPPTTTTVLGGFFRIEGTTITAEGTDSDNIPVTSTTILSSNAAGIPDHLLHFTSILSATSGDQYAADSTGGGQITGRAAEVAYLLDPIPTGSTGGVNPVKTFKLVRRQRVACLKDTDKAGFNAVAKNADVAVIALSANAPPAPASASPGVNKIFSLTDLKSAANRLQKASATVYGDEFLSAITDTYNNTSPPGVATGGNRVGEDVLLANVISFEVKAVWDQTPPPAPPTTYPPPNPPPSTTTNGDYPYDVVPGGAYDSTSSLIRIKAIQVRIRVYDPALKSARQITIVQDM